jgi:hypothetical protein
MIKKAAPVRSGIKTVRPKTGRDGKRKIETK